MHLHRSLKKAEKHFVFAAAAFILLSSSFLPAFALSRSTYSSTAIISDSVDTRDRVSGNDEKNDQLEDEIHDDDTTTNIGTADDNIDLKKKKDLPLYSYRTIQVHAIHRHGDRTPITPLKNEDFWEKELIPDDLIKIIAKGTEILRHDSRNSATNHNHAAGGRGPFGKLTKLGLLQMIKVGNALKDELEKETIWVEKVTARKITKSVMNGVKVKFTPDDIRVYSTDFARTIQSVQGTLMGFFPEMSEDGTVIDIDCRDTISWMIPDPQPRRTREQELLERSLAKRPHILRKEASMRYLAIRVTKSLLPLLQDGAFDISFGVEDKKSEREKTSALSWIQLTEITKCLSVREILPKSITILDQKKISNYTAWKWFQSLRSPRLAYLSMCQFTQKLVKSMQRSEQEPPLTIYSCHDSSLIGLLCALHLEKPSHWPEYGALMKIELLEKKRQQPLSVKEEEDADETYYKENVLRFYLNGELLRSTWNDNVREEISLEEFSHLMSTVGSN